MLEAENRFTGSIDFSTGEYEGETDFGYLFGDGKFSFKSGSVLDGEWKDNTLEGNGTYNVPSEGDYSGGFINNQKSGKGSFTWRDGSVYTGEWKEDKITGNGELKTSNGIVYSGTFKDNCFYAGECAFSNGTGRFKVTYSDGKIENALIKFSDGTKYKGEIGNDSISGVGKMVFTSKDIFYGEFKNGVRDGKGAYKWKSGDVYDGEWSSDTMSGKGKYTFVDGSTLEGTFSDNQFVEGTYHVKNNWGDYTFQVKNGNPYYVEMKLKSGIEYAGEMNKKGLNGKAKISYKNGDSYDGNVKNGVKAGKGIYTWRSGATYDGNWSKDRMQGYGVYTYSSKESGLELRGKFKNGKPNGECRYYTLNDDYKTKWKNGKCIKIYE
jgi:hypothetical protein